MTLEQYQQELKARAEALNGVGLTVRVAGRAEHLATFSSLTNLDLIMRDLIDRGFVNQAPKAIRILFGKLSEATTATRVLLWEGFPGPAAAVLRSSFEASVHLRLILEQDTADRATLFAEYLHVERHVRLKDSTAISDSDKRRNEDAFDKVKCNYHPRWPWTWYWRFLPSPDPKRIAKGVPGNATLSDVCDHLAESDHYEMLYGNLSCAIHPVPSYETWLRRADGHMDVGPKFNENTKTLGGLAAAFTARVVVELLESLDPAPSEKLLIETVAAAALAGELEDE